MGQQLQGMESRRGASRRSEGLASLVPGAWGMQLITTLGWVLDMGGFCFGSSARLQSCGRCWVPRLCGSAAGDSSLSRPGLGLSCSSSQLDSLGFFLGSHWLGGGEGWPPPPRLKAGSSKLCLSGQPVGDQLG